MEALGETGVMGKPLDGHLFRSLFDLFILAAAALTEEEAVMVHPVTMAKQGLQDRTDFLEGLEGMGAMGNAFFITDPCSIY